jgi:DNA-binding CsgD family transcriptional regulator
MLGREGEPMDFKPKTKSFTVTLPEVATARLNEYVVQKLETDEAINRNDVIESALWAWFAEVPKRQAITKALEVLTPREELVIRPYLVENPRRSIAELATEFKVSPQRIYSIRRRALTKLRHPDRAEAFEAMLDAVGRTDDTLRRLGLARNSDMGVVAVA